LSGTKHSNWSFLNVNFTKKVLLDWARPEEREKKPFSVTVKLSDKETLNSGMGN